MRIIGMDIHRVAAEVVALLSTMLEAERAGADVWYDSAPSLSCPSHEEHERQGHQHEQEQVVIECAGHVAGEQGVSAAQHAAAGAVDSEQGIRRTQRIVAGFARVNHGEVAEGRSSPRDGRGRGEHASPP